MLMWRGNRDALQMHSLSNDASKAPEWQVTAEREKHNNF